jgi:hypothetical protein
MLCAGVFGQCTTSGTCSVARLPGLSLLSKVMAALNGVTVTGDSTKARQRSYMRQATGVDEQIATVLHTTVVLLDWVSACGRL